jgi:alkanesulfonate monooxygenase SsuD/methylene tetrahydromethanopterin reductase-like flavin-dependent oxidoreductase (luciferase family)
MIAWMTQEIGHGETLGFEAVWLAELHFNRRLSILSSPMLVAASLASRTRRLRLGIGVNVLAIGDPLRRAEDAATLDLLSGGRLEFGVGRGHQKIAYDGFSVPMEEARDRLRENLEIILRAWTEEEFSYRGKFHTIPPVSVTPKPVQKPHPPIWMAAITPESFESAARGGYPAIITGHIPPPLQIEETADLYHQSYKDGRQEKGNLLAALYPVYVTEKKEDAYDAPQKHILYYFAQIQSAIAALPPSASFHGQTVEQFRRITYEQIFRERAIFGRPEEVLEKIGLLRERLGLNYFIAWFNFGAMDHNRVIHSMTLFAERVLPRL